MKRKESGPAQACLRHDASAILRSHHGHSTRVTSEHKTKGASRLSPTSGACVHLPWRGAAKHVLMQTLPLTIEAFPCLNFLLYKTQLQCLQNNVLNARHRALERKGSVLMMPRNGPRHGGICWESRGVIWPLYTQTTAGDAASGVLLAQVISQHPLPFKRQQRKPSFCYF